MLEQLRREEMAYRYSVIEDLISVAKELRCLQEEERCLVLQQELLFTDSKALSLEEIGSEYFANPLSIKGATLSARYKLLGALKASSVDDPIASLHSLFSIINITYGDDLKKWRFACLSHYPEKITLAERFDPHDKFRCRLTERDNEKRVKRAEVIAAAVDYHLINFIRAFEPGYDAKESRADQVESLTLLSVEGVQRDQDRVNIPWLNHWDTVEYMHISDKAYEQRPEPRRDRLYWLDGKALYVHLVDDTYLFHAKKLYDHLPSLTEAQTSVINDLFDRFNISFDEEQIGLVKTYRQMITELLGGE